MYSMHTVGSAVVFHPAHTHTHRLLGCIWINTGHMFLQLKRNDSTPVIAKRCINANLADPKAEAMLSGHIWGKKRYESDAATLCELCPIGSAKHSEQNNPSDLAVLCLLYQEVCIFACIHKKRWTCPDRYARMGCCSLLSAVRSSANVRRLLLSCEELRLSPMTRG